MRVSWTDLDGLIRVGNDSDEQAEHHVDEEWDEGVKVKSAEQPHHVVLVPHVQEGGVHVVPIDEGEEALSHFVKCSELGTKNVCFFFVWYFSFSLIRK